MAQRSATRPRARQDARAEPQAEPAARAHAADYVVQLQRSAGNAAVAALIARDEAAPAPAPPPDKTGIGARVAVGRFVEAAKKVQADWDTLGSAKARGKAFGAAANAELKAAGVPEVKIKVMKLGNAGSFDFSSWTLELGKPAFEGPKPSHGDLMETADTVYHETRHAEQWFRMARLQAGKGWSASKISTKLSIPLKVAKAAVKSKLVGTGTEVTEASAWYENVYGTGRKARSKTLKTLTKTRKELEKALAAYTKVDADPKASEAKKGAALKKLEAAQKKREDALKAYHALPEEADAWSVAADVQTELLFYDRT